MPAPFGVDDPTDLFSVDGWLPDHIVPAGGPDANYGRLPPQPDGVRPGSTHLIRARRQG